MSRTSVWLNVVVVVNGSETRLISPLCTVPGEQSWKAVTSLGWQEGAALVQELDVKRCTVAIHISAECIFQVHFSAKSKEFLQQDKS